MTYMLLDTMKVNEDGGYILHRNNKLYGAYEDLDTLKLRIMDLLEAEYGTKREPDGLSGIMEQRDDE